MAGTAIYYVATNITVGITECWETTPGPLCDTKAAQQDPEVAGPKYKLFAGPVSVTSPHNCINAYAWEDIPRFRERRLGELERGRPLLAGRPHLQKPVPWIETPFIAPSQTMQWPGS